MAHLFSFVVHIILTAKSILLIHSTFIKKVVPFSNLYTDFQVGLHTAFAFLNITNGSDKTSPICCWHLSEGYFRGTKPGLTSFQVDLGTLQLSGPVSRDRSLTYPSLDKVMHIARNNELPTD